MDLFLDEPLFSTLNQMLSLPDDMEKLLNVPTRTYVGDTKTMASTPVDIKEYPNSYVFIVDMPGLKSEDVRVQVEDKVLTISGERKREENEDTEVKYIRKERRVRRFMRKFPLPDNADIDSISAVCQDGVLTVTVPKVQPPETKKPKTIEVKAVDSEGAAARTQETPEVKGGESRD